MRDAALDVDKATQAGAGTPASFLRRNPGVEGQGADQPRLTRRSSSQISRTAPMVMALSAMLNDG